MQVFFERREELVPRIWQHFFRPERPVDFVSGQYADVHLPQAAGDPRGQARTFTLTSLPGESLISFITKDQAQPTPYKQALAALQPGDPARLDDAMGDLVLPKLVGLPLVFVAGGIGIASYASMLQELLRRREERSIFFFYALRDRREQIFRDLTGAYPLELSTLSVSPNRLTAKQIIDSTPPHALIYLSGSERFVLGLQTQLEALGKPRSSIIFDFFDGYTEL